MDTSQRGSQGCVACGPGMQKLYTVFGIWACINKLYFDRKMCCARLYVCAISMSKTALFENNCIRVASYTLLQQYSFNTYSYHSD